MKTLVSQCGRDWLAAHQTYFVFMAPCLASTSLHIRGLPGHNSEGWACFLHHLSAVPNCHLDDDNIISKSCVELGGTITLTAVISEALSRVTQTGTSVLDFSYKM